MAKKKTSRNPQDATLRNVRAQHEKYRELRAKVKELTLQLRDLNRRVSRLERARG